MCGLVGFLNAQPAQRERAENLSILETMTNEVFSRGPDDFGIWGDKTNRVALGFRRLAIQDLSDAANQPMVSASQRYIIVCNGEIYNFQALRHYCQNHNWRSRGDTEVLLHLIENMGVEKTLTMLTGMFAFALWDAQEEKLYLARDRVGEKPLYYGVENGVFFFASELTALLAHPDFEAKVDKKAAVTFLRYGYVPEPLSIYENTKKLEPGTFLCVDANLTITQKTYWSAEAVFQRCQRSVFKGSREDAISELNEHLLASLRQQMTADVNIGAFLSGGIDSSLVVGMMSHLSSQPVHSFSVGFQNSRFDESCHAEAVAGYLRTSHRTFQMSDMDCLEIIPFLQQIYDEPFADPSQLPTAFLCRMARTYSGVCLVGDGGDELFGGYGRYWEVANQWKRVANLSEGRKAATHWAIKKMTGNHSRFARRIRKFLNGDYHNTCAEYYANHMSRWRLDEGLYSKDDLGVNVYDQALCEGEGISCERALMHRDFVSYLPSNLLVKTDRASMASGLELRSPLLDHNFVEFVWSLPDEYTVGDHKKGILRDLLYRYVPANIVDRPKQGFEPPLQEWLRGSLKDWADDLLSHERLKDSSFYHSDVVQRRWQEHRNGQRSWAYPLWTVLMFENWLDQMAKKRKSFL